MSQFVFEVLRSDHEGGTKYYQILNIASSDSNRSVSVTHWGSIASGASLQPKHHGTVKIEKHNGFSTSYTECQAAKRNKTKRGYEHWNSVINRTDLTETGFSEIVRGWFSESKAKEILDHLKPSISGISATSIIVDDAVQPTVKVAPKVKADAPTQSNESWGTW